METSFLGGIIGKLIFTILALVALYYLYQYLFSSNGLEGKSALNTIIVANPATALSTPIASLPALYEGGEYSINTWIYINDYDINHGKNKFVLSLGGTNFSTLLIYLGAYNSSLHVRVHTKDSSITTTNPGPNDIATNSLTDADIKAVFGTQTIPTELNSYTPTKPCDIPNVQLQKWIQVTVTLNTKICDVYIDGKLARSCILPSFYKVSKVNTGLKLLDKNGFGGFISNTTAYNYALNPEQVWRMYMAGPGSQYTFWGYIKAMFDPNSINTMNYPKMNVVG
jgi:hypothetical protein